MKRSGIIILAITAIILTLSTALALNAGNIDLVYYKAGKPLYEVQFLTVPLAYEAGTVKKIVYGAGTNFSIQVTKYCDCSLVVKLVNLGDGNSRVVGWLSRDEPSKEITVSNLYPGYWTIVLVPSGNYPTWDISKVNPAVPAGPHEIEIVGNPKLILELLSPKNVTIGDCAIVRVEIKGLYGTARVDVTFSSQHTLKFSKVLGGANGNVWTIKVPTDKLGTGVCNVTVSTMGIVGHLSFNIVPVKVSLKPTVTPSKVNSSKVNETREIRVNKTVKTNLTTNRTAVSKITNTETGRKNNTTSTPSTAVTNTSATVKLKKTPGFEAFVALIAVAFAALRRRF